MSELDQIAHEYVERFAALDPLAATSMGVPGHDAEVPDFSPDGAEARLALGRETLAALDAAPAESARDRRARDVMVERLILGDELFDAGEHLHDLNIIASPMQRLRSAFDLMPIASETDWENVAARMEGVPGALEGMRASLSLGQERGLSAAARQVRTTIEQARTWAGVRGADGSFFHGLIEKAGSPRSAALVARLRRGVGALLLAPQRRHLLRREEAFEVHEAERLEVRELLRAERLRGHGPCQAGQRQTSKA